MDRHSYFISDEAWESLKAGAADNGDEWHISRYINEKAYEWIQGHLMIDKEGNGRERWKRMFNRENGGRIYRKLVIGDGVVEMLAAWGDIEGVPRMREGSHVMVGQVLELIGRGAWTNE